MNDPVIIDASVWLAVLLQEEGTIGIGNLLENHTLLAPELIKYETANGIIVAKKRNRIPKNLNLEHFLDIIVEFPIQTIPIEKWWQGSVKLIKRYDLTFYAAAYVGAAMSLKIPLVTLDKKVQSVMDSEKIQSIRI